MTRGGEVKHYFVDEAGDLTLFNKRGRIIVGNEGVSRCFMLGLLELPDPALAHKKLEELRQELLANHYFSSAPSMQVKGNKTAIAFHANNDLPEVRYEVMRLLPSFDAKAIVGIRRKQQLAEHYKLIYLRT